MGKAFNRLTRQVLGRTGVRPRRISFGDRMRQLEVILLELSTYLESIATDAQSPGDQALVAAVTDFKKHLEETII